jgi:type I restriction enzyme, S subunit
VQPGDIVVGRKGDLSRRAYISEHERGWFCGTDCTRIRPDVTRINPRFLSYYFGLSAVGEWLHRYDTGSTLPSLNTSNLSLLPVVVPPLDGQSAIVDVLHALDDKIECNDRDRSCCNDLLQAVFRRTAAAALSCIADSTALPAGWVPASLVEWLALAQMLQQEVDLVVRHWP